MRNIGLLICLLPLSVFGQYRGGTGCGWGSGPLLAGLNPPANVYTGGLGSGFNSTVALSQNPADEVYRGGSGDGFSGFTLLAANPAPSFYFGGSDDGFARIELVQVNPMPSFYFGGPGDGWSGGEANGQNPPPQIYFGGGNDGWATVTVVNQNAYTALPVTLLRFNGRWAGHEALLTWTTSSERNNARFDVERSTDGQQYQHIGTMPGRGTTTTEQEYGFTDTSVRRHASPVFFYRLRQVDGDGRISYSGIVRLSRQQKAVVSIFPNPTAGRLTLQIQATGGLRGYRYWIVSGAGAIVRQGEITNAQTQLDLSGLPAGSFWLRIANGADEFSTFQVILIR